MKYNYLKIIFMFCAISSPLFLHAQTVYITDQLQAGLHADKAITSPILKTLSTGTPLEVIKAEDKLSFVRAPDGVSGWIDNSYLVQAAPANLRLREAETRIRSLEQSLAKSREIQDGAVVGDVAAIKQLEDEKIQAEQQLKSERVKTAELQVQIAELRKNLGQDNSTTSLYEKIDQLSVENKQLQVRLAQALDDLPGSGSELLPGTDVSDNIFTTRNIVLALATALLVGVAGGLYLMDIINRRRHGGFRV